MTATLRSAAAHLDGVEGLEAGRIRDRATVLGVLPDLPTPLDKVAVASAHSELSRALEATFSDLDVLQRSGGTNAAAADQALGVVRSHLAPRCVRDFQTISIAGGMLGRG